MRMESGGGRKLTPARCRGRNWAAAKGSYRYRDDLLQKDHMAAIEPSMFDWRDVDARSDSDRFYLVRDHLPDGQLLQYLEVMRGAGHDDYSVAAMWNALIDGVVFQHLLVGALLRELGRSPALMQVCDPRGGFRSRLTDHLYG
jgi:hypothetical protein